MVNGFDGFSTTVLGPLSCPAEDSISDRFAFATGALPVAINNLDPILAAVPSSPVAVMLKVAKPASLGRGVPMRVRLSSSSDSHEGLPINE